MTASTAATDWARNDTHGTWSPRRRNLAGACLAHVLHDGYTDQLYALLPLWQSQFGLSYAGLALVRALYYGTMGGLQIPADRTAARLSPRAALALSTLVAAAGFLVMALPLGFAGLCCGLILAGIGSSVQHPRASLLVTASYGAALARCRSASTISPATWARRPSPRSSRCCCPSSPGGPWSAAWHWSAGRRRSPCSPSCPRQPVTAPARREPHAEGHESRGFALLVAIGAFDTATRMGYLLFLPFMIHAKGGPRGHRRHRPRPAVRRRRAGQGLLRLARRGASA